MRTRTNTILTPTARFLNESVRRKSPSECIWDKSKSKTKGKSKMTNYKSNSDKRTTTKTKQRRVDKWVEKVKSRR